MSPKKESMCIGEGNLHNDYDNANFDNFAFLIFFMAI